MKRLLVAGATVLALGVQPALAQNASDTSNQAATPPAGQGAAHGQTTPGAVALPEVTVTATPASDTAGSASSATRTNTPLIQVPQSVQVLPQTLLKEQDARTLGDALVNVSGVVPTKPEEIGFTAPIVRGFPAEIYLDGLPQYGATEASNDPTSLVGVQRIEVVKGPTSTLYGGGLGSPLGGLINIVSEQPTRELGGFVAMRTGSFSTYDPYGEVNVPLGEFAAARLSGEYQGNNSWIDRVTGQRWSLNPSFSAQLDPATQLLLQGQYTHRSDLEYSGLPAAQALAGQLDRHAFPGATTGQPQTTTDNETTTITLKHAFADDLRLTVTGRYYSSNIKDYGSFFYPSAGAPNPATPTAYPIFTIYLPTRVDETTADANLSKTFSLLGLSHTVLGGLDYDYTQFRSDLGFTGVPIGTLDFAQPSGVLAYGSPPPATTQTATDRYATIAGYIQDQANYGRLHLTGSLRYTALRFEEKELLTDLTYYHLSPRIGATVDLVDGIAVYSGYSTGFRAPFQFIGLQPPKPETSKNTEVGLKLALKEIGLSGTVALFQQTRDNVATPDPTNPFYSIQTGQQRARGAEMDLVWEPRPSFSLLANCAYTDATVTADNTIPVGDALPRVPKYSGRVAARYRVLGGWAEGLSFGAGVTAYSARQLTLPNTVAVPGTALVDAQAAYDFGRYTVQLTAVNLTNRRTYDAYEYLGFPVVIPTQPLSIYATVKARF
jgi:iron complex outermembrane receptor protein